jgi:hypothetical protein
MQCQRLLQLTKQWYLHVKDETMAPARMVQFIKQHVSGCQICQEDPDIEGEIVRITEIILPESKIPKAVRLKQEAEDAERQQLEDAEEENNNDDSDDSENDELVEEDDEDPLDS